jgi:hypothetical protein
MNACIYGHKDVVKLLLKNGRVDPRYPNYNPLK